MRRGGRGFFPLSVPLAGAARRRLGKRFFDLDADVGRLAGPAALVGNP